MADAKSGVHQVKLKEVCIPQSLIKGDKFLKWDDETGNVTPVTLKVDPKGFLLFWKEHNKDVDSLDISLIRDTRTGSHANVPKDSRQRDLISFGPADIPLEEKTVTVVHGTDTVNVNFTNFVAVNKDVAKEWADIIFKCAINLLGLNRSPLGFLEKCHSKLSIMTVGDGIIPVKNIIKMFANHKDDRRKIEKALEASHLPFGKNDGFKPEDFKFRRFMSFYKYLCGRHEVEEIFRNLGSRKKPYLTTKQFVSFLNEQQRDPRLNEILYPYYDTEKAQHLIDMFELNDHMAIKDPDVPKGHLSQEGFLQYLLSDQNSLISPAKLDISEDMTQPLSHYFINSSHNTYLTGHQFTGKSSVEIYRQVLLTGCRCVELDCWDGRSGDEEPIITHGFTMCTEVLFKEVMEAIAETAFKISDYPIVLSFENHCSQKQQQKMAYHCRTILGDLLLKGPLESHSLDMGVSLPCPALLKRKIIIKNKKRHTRKKKHRQQQKKTIESKQHSHDTDSPTNFTSSMEMSRLPGERGEDVEDDLSSESDSDDDSLTEEQNADDARVPNHEKESEAGMEMSQLVTYIQPIRFHSFDFAEKRDRSYECTSFVETHATSLLKEQPLEFVNYNKRQLTRIYPRGTRVDSSNYMPQIFWNAGCQLVALNYQTLDLPLQLNLGIFEYNGRSGYILKPDFMRRNDRRFDPFAESTVDGIVAGTVSVKVISAQFLTDKKVGTYVEVEMYGLPADTVRKRFKTRVVSQNGINPCYNEEPFVFKKVVLPNLATLRIVACEENGRLLGQRILPVEGLRPGYRHIPLRNELNQPQNLSTVFVHLKVGDYVPDAFADFAAALANPIAYQSALEKHAEQLAVLEDEMDTEEVVPEESAPVEHSACPVMATRGAGPSTTPRLQRQKSVKTTANTALPDLQVISSDSPPRDRVYSLTNSPTRALLRRVSSLTSGRRTHASSTLTSATSIDKSSTVSLNQQLNFCNYRISDWNMSSDITLSSIQTSKAYQKIVSKHTKELENLNKKLNKSQMILKELHVLQEEKLTQATSKSKNILLKTHSKTLKSNIKTLPVISGETLPQNIQEKLRYLNNQNAIMRRQQREHQAKSMMALCKEHYLSKRELNVKFCGLTSVSLNQLIETKEKSIYKEISDIHDCDVEELKKKLDIYNKDERKSLAKKHKEKNELSRIKREALNKHINLAVQERKKLQALWTKKKEDVGEAFDALRIQVIAKKENDEGLIIGDYNKYCTHLDNEYSEMFDINGHESAPNVAPLSYHTSDIAPTPSSTNSTPVNRSNHSNCTSTGHAASTSFIAAMPTKPTTPIATPTAVRSPEVKRPPSTPTAKHTHFANSESTPSTPIARHTPFSSKTRPSPSPSHKLTSSLATAAFTKL